MVAGDNPPPNITVLAALFPPGIDPQIGIIEGAKLDIFPLPDAVIVTPL